MMTYNMSYDQVLDMTLTQFSSCLRMANIKICCDYKENYKVFMSKLPEDIMRSEKINGEFKKKMKEVNDG